MKDNKHPHHDLIVEWAKDTSKTIQGRLNGDWAECFIGNVTNDRAGSYEFRFKPREFTKGHWHPCITKIGRKDFYRYAGENIFLSSYDEFGVSVDVYPLGFMDWIGESLGEIDFG